MEPSIHDIIQEARVLLERTPELSFAPAKKALAMAEDAKDNNAMIESFFILAVAYNMAGKNKEMSYNLSSAYELINDETPPRLKAYVYSYMGTEYGMKFQKDAALNLTRKALETIVEVDDYHCQIFTYVKAGATYILLSFFVEALDILLKAESLLKEDIPYREEGYIYSHLSIIYSKIKNYEHAIKWSFKAEEAFGAINDHRGLISTYTNRALAFHAIEKIEDSILNLEKGLELCLRDFDRYTMPLGSIYLNLSFCYINDVVNNHEKALEYYKKAYSIYEITKAKNLLPVSILGIVSISNKLDKEIPQKISDKYGGLEQILRKGLEMSEDLKDHPTSQMALHLAIDFYLKNNNYKKAFFLQKRLGEINEILSKREKDENIFLLDIKYQMYQKELRLQQLELEKKELELKQKEKLKSINKSLEEKVRQRTNQLLIKNQELEQYAYIVAHDLKEPIRSIVGFAQLLEKRSSLEMSDMSKELLKFIVDASYSMREMVDDLLQFSTIQVDKNKMKEIKTRNLIDIILINLKNSFKVNQAELILENMPETIYGDSTQIKQLFQNLISNAIKFKHPDRAPVVTISCKKLESAYQFSISDNGLGIKKEYHDQIFLLFKRLHTKQQFSGSGIGLSICKKIVLQHGGNIWIESEEGVGTSFIFTLKQDLFQETEQSTVEQEPIFYRA